MKFNRLIAPVILAIFPIIGFSQGLIFNDSIKSQLNSTFEGAEVSRSALPASVSLKDYAPWVHHQLGSECLAYSMATAHTIIQAVAYDWTDIKQISQNSFSPHFIYYRNKNEGDNDCMMGLDPMTVASDILNTGMAYLRNVECPEYYPCNMEQRLCEYYPPDVESDLEIAANNKIDNVYMIENVQQIKSVLANQLPVVVGMRITESFTEADGDLWEPVSGEPIDPDMGHAMVVVGYDNYKYGGAIQLMNSWGKSWGNDGFIWIKYDDAMDYIDLGMALDRTIGVFAENQNANEESQEGEPVDDEASDEGFFKWLMGIVRSAYDYLFGEEASEADVKLGLGISADSIHTDYPIMASDQMDN